MKCKVVGPVRIVTEVWGEQGQTLFEVTAYTGDAFIAVRSREGQELYINPDEIEALVKAIKRARTAIDCGVKPVGDAEPQ